MRSGPRNPFLADSGNAMAHGRCDQQDNTPGPGPEGPTDVLGPGDIQYAPLGPGHFGGVISGRYPDGRRVIWSNGRQIIAKLDYDTLEVLATLPTGTEPITDQAELEALEAGLDDLDGDDAVAHAIGIAARFMTGLDGVYSLLDCDHTLFLGHKPAYTPYGLHKYEWDPVERRLKQAWINTEVSSSNSVPFVAEASNLVYTCGTRDGKWTIEAVDWTTGESRFHYVVGGSRYNTLGGGVTVDDDGRLLYGTIFGKARILR